MAEDPRARSDGVTIAPGRSPGKAWLALAGAVVVAGTALFALFRTPATAVDPTAPQARVEASAPPAPPRAEPAPPAPAAFEVAERARPPAHEDSPVGAPPPPRATAGGADETERERTPSGIALFPPRGSEPVRVGLVVPDGFELPEGFMRHYQVTDDGQELPPILVVHPDYELLDAQGQPVPRPEGGVVPPDLAPPGLPIETLVVPDPPAESGP